MRQVAKPESAAGLPLRSRLAWVSILSLASGFPYGLVAVLVPVYLRDRGSALSYITQVVSIASFAWTLKFAWAFLVDRFGTRKAWILACEIALAGGIICLAIVSPSSAPVVFGVVLLGIAVLSATQDIALDAYTIELFTEEELGPANGARVTAYRVAMIAAGGALVWIAGKSGSWKLALLLGSAAMAALFAATIFLPATRTRSPAQASLASAIWLPLRGLVKLPGFAPVLLFVITFKLGDNALTLLASPFWVDRGLSAQTIGVMVGTVGFGATIVGAIAGGWATHKLGVFRALWLLGLIQAISNLGYWWAASSPPSLELAYTAVIVEQFTGGLGTAAFLAFLMSICDRGFAASQYALLSAAYGLGRTAVQYVSGGLAERLGYSSYFLLTFVLAFPAFLLLPWVRRLKTAREPGLADA